MRVVIADDHALVRRGLRYTLERHNGEFTVVGEAVDGLVALELVDSSRADVLLLDHKMPVVSGLDVLEALQKREARPRVVVVSGTIEPWERERAFSLGADAFYFKANAPDQLIELLRALPARREMGPPQSRLDDSTSGSACDAFAERLLKLTKREREVCDLLAAGLDESAAASKLKVSPETLRTHVSNVRVKLELRSRAELLRVLVASRRA